MLLSLFITSITGGAIFLLVRLLRKLNSDRPFSKSVAFVASVAMAIGAFLLALLIVDLTFGIGPDVLTGNVSAPSALRMAMINFAIAAWLAWIQVRAKSNTKIPEMVSNSEPPRHPPSAPSIAIAAAAPTPINPGVAVNSVSFVRVQTPPVDTPTSPVDKALDDEDEKLWAQALAEVDGAERRPGLWAKSFAEASGDESSAKAAYLSARVAEMQRARRAAKLEAEQSALAAVAKATADSLAQAAARREIEMAPEALAKERQMRRGGCEKCAHYRLEVPFMQDWIWVCTSDRSGLAIRPGLYGAPDRRIIDSLSRASFCLGFKSLK